MDGKPKTFDGSIPIVDGCIDIFGVKYSLEVFQQLGLGPVGSVLQIEQRKDGVITLKRIDESAEPLMEQLMHFPLVRASEALEVKHQKASLQFDGAEINRVGRMVCGALAFDGGPLLLGIFNRKREIGVHEGDGTGFRTVNIGRTINIGD